MQVKKEVQAKEAANYLNSAFIYKIPRNKLE